MNKEGMTEEEVEELFNDCLKILINEGIIIEHPNEAYQLSEAFEIEMKDALVEILYCPELITQFSLNPTIRDNFMTVLAIKAMEKHFSTGHPNFQSFCTMVTSFWAARGKMEGD